MAILGTKDTGIGSSIAKVAATATAKKAPISKTPTKTATKVLATPKPTDNIINTIGNEGTVSLRGSLMPQAQSDGSYLPWSTAGQAETPTWSLEGDPLYQSALAAGKSAFSFAQAQALADKQNQETGAAQQRKQLDTNATESRRRVAGNYAARGMAGGAAGALSMAEARANAEQVAARTSITDQLTALNNQYLQNYGDASVKDPITGKSTYDWTGTLAGQQYKTQAAQAAVQAQLARYGAA